MTYHRSPTTPTRSRSRSRSQSQSRPRPSGCGLVWILLDFIMGPVMGSVICTMTHDLFTNATQRTTSQILTRPETLSFIPMERGVWCWNCSTPRPLRIHGPHCSSWFLMVEFISFVFFCPALKKHVAGDITFFSVLLRWYILQRVAKYCERQFMEQVSHICIQASPIALHTEFQDGCQNFLVWNET